MVFFCLLFLSDRKFLADSFSVWNPMRDPLWRQQQTKYNILKINVIVLYEVNEFSIFFFVSWPRILVRKKSRKKR